MGYHCQRITRRGRGCQSGRGYAAREGLLRLGVKRYKGLGVYGIPGASSGKFGVSVGVRDRRRRTVRVY
jgi:hypothetical protein